MSLMLKLVSPLVVLLTLAGCQDAMQQLNRDLASANAALSGGNSVRTASQPTMAAAATRTDNVEEVKIIVPTDPRTREAMDVAMPTIKTGLSIHQCVAAPGGMFQLNYLAVPGVDLANGGVYWSLFPNSREYLKYHDRSKCVSVRAVDNWAMPALNALQFRAVFFADDSGETVNFVYLMKKVDDGSWKFQSIARR